MAPQTSIPLAANVLGTIGTVFWCIQLVPQIWHNWRKKSTEGLPGLMLFMWAICMWIHLFFSYWTGVDSTVQVPCPLECMPSSK